jgi:hypothetical protein
MNLNFVFIDNFPIDLTTVLQVSQSDLIAHRPAFERHRFHADGQHSGLRNDFNDLTFPNDWARDHIPAR